MSVTTVVESVNLNVEKMTKEGLPYLVHEVVYQNNGKRITKFVPVKSPVANKISDNLSGKKVTLHFIKQGNFFNLNDITKPTVEEATTHKVAKPPQQTDWAAKDLSMELGGLMHDAALLVANGKRDNLLDTLRELVSVKRTVGDEVKAGNVGVVPVAIEDEAEKFEVPENEPF